MASIVREITARIRNDAHILLCVLKSNFAFKRAQGDLSFFKFICHTYTINIIMRDS